jgi:hypothetical protein
VRRSVAPRRLELQLDLPRGVEPHPLVGKHRLGDVAAKLLQALAVVRLDPVPGRLPGFSSRSNPAVDLLMKSGASGPAFFRV